MIKTNFAAALLALSLYSWAQYAGWNLFDNEAGSQGQQLRSSGSGGRSYHK